MTMSKFVSKCILLGIILKGLFSIIVKAKFIILSGYGLPNETFTIDKCIKSRLIFGLSAKVAHIY